MSISEKYDQLKAGIDRHERIFKFVGIEDPSGGWFKKPHNDPDHNYAIPMLRRFFIPPTTARIRMQELADNGWTEYAPEPEPTAVKRSSRSSRKK